MPTNERVRARLGLRSSSAAQPHENQYRTNKLPGKGNRGAEQSAAISEYDYDAEESNMTANLTIADVTALNELIVATTTTAKVALVTDDGGTLYGIARAITPASGSGNHIDRQTDLRDGWVWITTRTGFEVWHTVASLMEKYHDGDFRIYDW